MISLSTVMRLRFFLQNVDQNNKGKKMYHGTNSFTLVTRWNLRVVEPTWGEIEPTRDQIESNIANL